MVLDELRLNNFLTYENLVYKFQSRPLLVQGINLTDHNQKSNGSGKSGIQTGIEYCITASNSRDVRDNELITFGCDEGRAQLFASCDHRKESIHIDWRLRIKGSNKVTIKTKAFDTEEWTDVSFSNVNDGKKYIVAWFAISKEDLFNYYLINKTRFKSFFKSSNKEKVDLINRFSDASIIEGLEDIDNTDLDNDFSAKEREINIIEGKVEVKEEDIEIEENIDLAQELERDKMEIDEEIEEVEKEIEEIEEDIESDSEGLETIDTDIDIENKNIGIASEDKVAIDKDIDKVTKVKETIEKIVEVAEDELNRFIKTEWEDIRSSHKEKKIKQEKNKEGYENRLEKSEAVETKIKTALKEIEVKLAGSITCPKCKHEFLPTSVDETVKALNDKSKAIEQLNKKNNIELLDWKKKVKNTKISISNMEIIISGINDKESEENKEIEGLRNTLNEVKQSYINKVAKINKLEVEKTGVDTDILNYKTKIESIKSRKGNIELSNKAKLAEIKSYERDIKALEKKKGLLKITSNKERINTLQEEKSALEHQKIALSKELTAIGDVIYSRNQWANNFKHFRMYLANQSLELISYHCNRYLHDMGSDIRVEINGFKVLANGTLKEEITTTVTRGIERTFSSFSGGEQGRLLFASILANRHMINSTHPYGGLDFLSIDEVFEGVDSLGLKHLIESSSALNITVMIITHVTDEDTGDDVVLVVKENDVSTIKQK